MKGGQSPTDSWNRGYRAGQKNIINKFEDFAAALKSINRRRKYATKHADSCRSITHGCGHPDCCDCDADSARREEKP